MRGRGNGRREGGGEEGKERERKKGGKEGERRGGKEREEGGRKGEKERENYDHIKVFNNMNTQGCNVHTSLYQQSLTSHKTQSIKQKHHHIKHTQYSITL